MICKSCNKELADDVNFCPYCGTAVSEPQDEPEVKICPDCKKEYEISMVFCEDCGAKLVMKNSATPEPTPDPQPEEAPLLTVSDCTTSDCPTPGELKIYPDRLEFTGFVDNQELGVDTYYINDIAKRHKFFESQYALCYSMKDGKRLALIFANGANMDQEKRRAMRENRNKAAIIISYYNKIV